MSDAAGGTWRMKMVNTGLSGVARLADNVGLAEVARLPLLAQAVRPADVSSGLHDAMLSRENIVEDANYQKVVPNHYVIQVSPANYARRFQPIAAQIVDQWRNRLLEDLMTANNRLGHKQYRFGGRLVVEVQAAEDLKDTQARILCRVEAEPAGGQAAAASRSPGTPASRAGGQLPGGQPALPPAGLPKPPAGNRMPPVNTPEPAGEKPSPQARTGLAPGVNPAGQQTDPALEAVTRPPLSGGPAAPPRGDGLPGGGPPPGARAPRLEGSAPQPHEMPHAEAYIEQLANRQRWALYPGINTIGRGELCQIYLDQPLVQEKRLVSGQHAYILMERGRCVLHDGSTDGRPSSNGTFVNGRRVPPAGVTLRSGDRIVLAAADTQHAREDTPGVAVFAFWQGPKGR